MPRLCRNFCSITRVKRFIPDYVTEIQLIPTNSNRPQTIIYREYEKKYEDIEQKCKYCRNCEINYFRIVEAVVYLGFVFSAQSLRCFNFSFGKNAIFKLKSNEPTLYIHPN